MSGIQQLIHARRCMVQIGSMRPRPSSSRVVTAVTILLHLFGELETGGHVKVEGSQLEEVHYIWDLLGIKIRERVFLVEYT